MSNEWNANLPIFSVYLKATQAVGCDDITFHRAVAPSPAGPAMAGPVFAAGTKILNIEDMHFKHTFKLGGGGGGGGGTGLRLNNVLKAE